MGLIGGIARTAVVAGTWTAVGNRVSRRQANRWAQKDQSSYAQPQYAPAPQYAQPQYAPAPQPRYAPAPQPRYAPAPQPQYAPAPYAPPAPTPVAGPSPVPDKYDQLKRLGELRDRGVLTEDEFTLQKSRILSA